MLDVDFIWDEEPGGNVEHIAEHEGQPNPRHDLTPEDVMHAFHHVERYTTSRFSGRPALIGEAQDGSLIFVAYTEIDATTMYVRTAYRI